MQQLMEEEMQHRAIDIINSIDYSVLTNESKPKNPSNQIGESPVGKPETELTNDNTADASNASDPKQQKPKR